MSLENVLASIRYWNEEPESWNMDESIRGNFQSITRTQFKSYFQQLIIFLYNNSETIRNMLDYQVSNFNFIRVAEYDLEPGKAFHDDYSPFIGLNFDKIEQYGDFNDKGEWVQWRPELVIAHELSHLFEFSDDPDSTSSLPINPAYELRGDAVDFQNQVALELGYTDAVRTAYASSGNLEEFYQGESYTFGNEIDVSWVQRATGNATMDTSLRGNSRDLLFGSLQDDIIKGGAGDDYLYGRTGSDNIEGGTGNDLLVGGQGNDILDGGNGDDILIGSEDDDVLIGRAGDDEIWGGKYQDDLAEGIDTADYSGDGKPIKISVSSYSGLTVRDGSGGTDRLHAIDVIKGTAGRDRVVIEGIISTETDQLTIDASGGQGLSPEDTIDLSGSESRNTIYIDEFGNGAINDLDTGGYINLEGFHTNLLGSYNDDTITDHASGPKRISANDGDDTITITGGPAYVDGGAGEDTITGGAFNDVLVGGLGSDTLYGGASSDTLIGLADIDKWIGADEDTLYGGDGSDLLINGKVMVGGAGNDVIDARGYVASNAPGATIKFQAGDGQDWIISQETAINSGVSSIDLSTVSLDDVTIYWDGNATPISTGSDNYYGKGNLSIVLNSGESISIGNVEGSYQTNWSNDKITIYLEAPTIIFSDGPTELIGPIEQEVNFNLIYSSYAPADAALSDYQSSLESGAISGTNGDDQLDGTSSNDDISAGSGNDDVSLSVGNDAIDGGDGDDTVTFFGSIEGFTLDHAGGGVRLTSTSGLEGTATITNVENFYSITDDRTWTLAQMFGRISTIGDDAMIGTDDDDSLFADAGDDTLKGFGGNDFLDGGDGNDQAIFRGNSTDYLINNFYGTQTVIDLVGNDGFDILQNVESIYFEGDQTTILVSDLNEIQGTEGDDSITGTNGRDSIYSSGGHDVINAGDGDDYISSSPGQNLIDGGNGSDIVSYWGDRSEYEITLGSNGSVYVVGLNDRTTNDVLTNVERLFFDGNRVIINVADLVPTEPSGPVPIYGTSSDDTLVGTADDDIIYGLDGDDNIDGGAGTDTMYGGAGNDFYTVDNSGDVIVEAVYEGWDGVSSSVSYTLQDNVEGLYLGSDSAIDGTGNDLDNEIYGNDYSNTLSGLGGADYIVGGYGNDRLIGGTGDDLLAGEDGSADVAVYAGLQSSFSLATVDGTVTITDNAPIVDGDEGTDSLYGIELVEFQGGIQAGISSPIILDLNGNGVTLVDNKQTKVGFDWDGDGTKNQTGWIGKDDGFLFIDRDGNGTVTDAGELSFTSDKDGAKSDLDGLRAFDINGDGIFSSLDDQFSQFKVWRDKNGNGRVDKKEILSLQKAGVASIDLTGEAVNQSWEWGENITVNTGFFTRTNGTVGSFSDVALSYDTTSSQNAAINKAASQLSEAMAGFWDGRGTAAFGKFEALAERGDNFLAVDRGGWR